MNEKASDDSASEGDETFLDDFIPYVMYRITNRMNMDLQDCLRPLKINVSRWRVLCALKARDSHILKSTMPRLIVDFKI